MGHAYRVGSPDIGEGGLVAVGVRGPALVSRRRSRQGPCDDGGGEDLRQREGVERRDEGDVRREASGGAAIDGPEGRVGGRMRLVAVICRCPARLKIVIPVPRWVPGFSMASTVGPLGRASTPQERPERDLRLVVHRQETVEARGPGADEGLSVRQEDVREVPDHPAAWAGLGDLSEPASQAASGVIDGSNRRNRSPRDKRLEIGLTYIFGVGLSTLQQDLAGAADRPRHQGRDLTEAEAVQIRQYVELELHSRGRPPSRVSAKHQAQDRDRLLSGHSPPSWASGAGPEDPHQRPHPQGQGGHRRQEESREVGA